jgi:hypothetical protein
MQVRDAFRDPLCQRPLPTTDLERHVAGLELRVPHDRVQQVRVGEEVLPEPHHWNTRAALASTVRSSSS